MPKYTFKCQCGWSDQRIENKKTKHVDCPTCGSIADRAVPFLSGPVEVRETVNDLGKTWRKDQDELINDRKQTHYWKHVVPELVNSGVYSMETMLERGWVYYDDKGQLHTRTTPPGK